MGKTGKFRCKFLKESILNLRHNLNHFNSDLIIRYGSSSNIIPKIVDEFDVNAVYFHSEIHSEEQKIVKDVISNCSEINDKKKLSLFLIGEETQCIIQMIYHLIAWQIYLTHS